MFIDNGHNWKLSHRAEAAALEQNVETSAWLHSQAQSIYARESADGERDYWQSSPDKTEQIERLTDVRERFRTAHKTHAHTRDALAQCRYAIDDYGDMDEYGYEAD